MKQPTEGLEKVGASRAVLSRYLAHGVSVRRIRPTEPERAQDWKLLALLEEDDSHPVRTYGMYFLQGVVAPVLRDWQHLPTYVDANGEHALTVLGRLAMNRTSPGDYTRFRIVRRTSVGMLIEYADNEHMRLYISRDWQVNRENVAGHHLANERQAEVLFYLLENLFAVGLDANEYFPQ